MQKHKFYPPFFALLFALMLMLAFSGQAKAEETEVSCGVSIEESVTMTVTDDFDFGVTLIESSSGRPNLAACGQEIDAHWSIPMCGDEIWRGYIEVPTECNTVSISDTVVLTTTWVDLSVIWDVSGQELVRAVVTETLPTRVEIWEEDSGRKLILFNLDDKAFPVYLDSVIHNDWVDNGDGKKKLTITNSTFNASFNLGDQPVIWENYAAYWSVSNSNTVDRIKVSPTRVQVFSENAGADLFLYNIDNMAFPVSLDGVIYNDWRPTGGGKLKLSIVGMNNAQSFNLGDQPVIWEDYSLDWDVSTINTVVRVNPPTVMYMIYLPATMK